MYGCQGLSWTPVEAADSPAGHLPDCSYSVVRHRCFQVELKEKAEYSISQYRRHISAHTVERDICAGLSEVVEGSCPGGACVTCQHERRGHRSSTWSREDMARCPDPWGSFRIRGFVVNKMSSAVCADRYLGLLSQLKSDTLDLLGRSGRLSGQLGSGVMWCNRDRRIIDWVLSS